MAEAEEIQILHTLSISDVQHKTALGIAPSERQMMTLRDRWPEQRMEHL